MKEEEGRREMEEENKEVKKKSNKKVQFALESDIMLNGNKIDVMPNKYNIEKKTDEGYRYNHMVNENDEKYNKAYDTPTYLNKIANRKLDAFHEDPYKSNNYTSFEVKDEHLNDFSDALTKKIVHNKEFLEKSPYSSISKDNLNTDVDKWRQIGYRDKTKDKINRLYFSKMANTKKQQLEKQVQDVNEKRKKQIVLFSGTYTKIDPFESVALEMETLLRQHQFVREVLQHIMPKVQLPFSKRKFINMNDFMILTKKSGIYIDSKEKVRSGIRIFSLKHKLFKHSIQLNFRFCEMQTEVVLDDEDEDDDNQIQDDISKDIRSLTQNKSKSVKRVNNSKSESVHKKDKNCKDDICHKPVDSKVLSLSEMSKRDMDAFMEDNLRLSITIVTLDDISPVLIKQDVDYKLQDFIKYTFKIHKLNFQIL